MKTAAIIDEFENMDSARSAQIKEIKEQSGADILVAVMSGNFLQSGFPAKESGRLRAQKALDAGVDVVLERPVYTALTSLDAYAPGGIALLDKLRSIDEIWIPISVAENELIEKVTFFLFSEPKTFQDTLKQYRRRGDSFYDAQAKAIGKAFPGLESFFKKQVNYTAFEYLKSLKRMYSNMKPRYLSGDYFPRQIPERERFDTKMDSFFLLMKYQMLLIGENMSRIYGGSATLTAHMLEQIRFYDQCRPFVEACVTKEHTAEDVRRFLFHLLLGIGKSDIAMSRMYDSAPYVCLLGCRDSAREWVDGLKKKSRIPVIENVEADYAKLSSACKGLFDIDLRASAIYHMAERD